MMWMFNLAYGLVFAVLVLHLVLASEPGSFRPRKAVIRYIRAFWKTVFVGEDK